MTMVRSTDNTGYTSPSSYSDNPVWEEEFDEVVWTLCLELRNGASGWGNNESQYYVRNKNAELDQGYQENSKRRNTSRCALHICKNNNQGKESFQYGELIFVQKYLAVKEFGRTRCLEIIWFGWLATCGEIDIMELIGDGYNDRTVYGTAHWSNNKSCRVWGKQSLPLVEKYNDEFQLFL